MARRDLSEEPVVEAAREHPLDAVAAPDDARWALQIWTEVAEKRLRPCEVGAADVELSEAPVPGEHVRMGRAVESDVEKSDAGEMREERQIGDRQSSCRVDSRGTEMRP